MGYAITVCRLILAGVFVLSAVEKLRAPNAFVDGVRGFRLLPPRFVRAGAYAVLFCEVCSAGLLAFSRTALAGFVLAGAVLALFTAAVAQAIRRGLNVPCPCFGVSTARVGLRHIIRNLILISAAVTGAALIVFGGAQGHSAAAGIVIATALAAVVVLLVRFTDDLAGLFFPES
jgi:hypothetical protein